MSLIQDALKKAQGDPLVLPPLGRVSYGRAGRGRWSWRLLIPAVGAIIFSFLLVRVPGMLLGHEPARRQTPSSPPIQSEKAAPVNSPDVPASSGRVAADPGPIGLGTGSPAEIPPPASRAIVEQPRPEAMGAQMHANAPAVKPKPDTDRLVPDRGVEIPPSAPFQERASKEAVVKPVVEGKDRYYFNMGLFYQKQREYGRAFEAYQKAVEFNPFYAETYNNLGVVSKEIGDLAKAVEYYRKALAIDPKYVKAYNNLGVALIRQGELEEAAAQFERALLLNPKNLESYTNLGVIYVRRNRIADALQAFEAALSIDPDHAETHYNLALLMEAQGRITKAVHHYRRFLASAGSDHGSAVSSAIARIRHLTRGTRSTAPPNSLRR